MNIEQTRDIAVKNMKVDAEFASERVILVENVLRILQEAKAKLRISLVFPRLLENPLAIHHYLEDEEKCATAIKLSDKCFKKMKYNLKKQENTTVDSLTNHDTVRLIDFFHENHALLKIPEEWIEQLSDKDQELLRAMDTLYYISEERLKRTAMEELLRERETYQLIEENAALIKEIEAAEKKNRTEKSNSAWKTSSQEVLISKYQEELALKKWNNSVRVKEEIQKSTSNMRTTHLATIVRQKELEEILEKVKEAYEKLLKKNLEEEKETRAEKNKLLLQLESLVKKYDSVIGDKMKESMRLDEEYEEEKKQFDTFMIEFQREEEQYIRIVRDRQDEEKRIFEENLALFIMNRAAKIIQRAWRRFWRERKKLMKKGKGKGKGKRK